MRGGTCSARAQPRRPSASAARPRSRAARPPPGALGSWRRAASGSHARHDPQQNIRVLNSGGSGPWGTLRAVTQGCEAAGGRAWERGARCIAHAR